VLPAGLGPIVTKLIASDARLRYQTAREVREAFQHCVGIGPGFPGAAGWFAKTFRGV